MVESTARMQSDALVIGAGPAGLVAAAGIARAGHRVIVIDSEVDTPEGTLFITRFGRQVLSDLEWIDSCSGQHGSRESSAMRVVSMNEKEKVQLGQRMLVLPRREIVEKLVNLVQEREVTVLRGIAAVRPLWEGQRVAGVMARTTERDEVHLTARATIDATGTESFLAASMGQLQPRSGPLHNRVVVEIDPGGVEDSVLGIVGSSWLLLGAGHAKRTAFLVPGETRRRRDLLAHMADAVETLQLGFRVRSEPEDIDPIPVGYVPRLQVGDGWIAVGEAALGVGLGLPGSASVSLAIAASAAWEVDLAIRNQRTPTRSQFGATLTLIRQALNFGSVFDRVLVRAAAASKLSALTSTAWRRGAAGDLLSGGWLPIRRRVRAMIFLWVMGRRVN